MIYTTQVPHLEKGIRSGITLGKFDGLHRGHQKLINCIKERQSRDCRTVIFTFDVAPKSFMLHTSPRFLLTYEERRELAEGLGVDILAECPFTEELMHMEPEAFVKEYLVDRLHGEYLAVGPDFRFGYQRKGTPQLLQELGKVYGFYTEIVEKEKYGNRDISSTYIREELEKGHMEEVNRLLGYIYFTKGEIVHGRQLGRTIGIPTANLIPPSIKKLPPNGVYITESVIQGKIYQGITNVGYKPTVKENFLGVGDLPVFLSRRPVWTGGRGEILLPSETGIKVFFSGRIKNSDDEKDIQTGKEYFLSEQQGSGRLKHIISVSFIL